MAMHEEVHKVLRHVRLCKRIKLTSSLARGDMIVIQPTLAMCQRIEKRVQLGVIASCDTTTRGDWLIEFSLGFLQQLLRMNQSWFGNPAQERIWPRCLYTRLDSTCARMHSVEVQIKEVFEVSLVEGLNASYRLDHPLERYLLRLLLRGILMTLLPLKSEHWMKISEAWLRDLASVVHTYYNTVSLCSLDLELNSARLALLVIIKKILMMGSVKIDVSKV